jgi:CheY-like chemotaxis protein/signal recognition particle receptor subunit beta
MALFNHATKEVTAKLVYYGPGLCGKTTNLQWIHDNLSFKSKGKLVSLATQTDRTLFFDFLPVELGTIRGMRTRMQIYTVPGQVFYESTRRMVLKGCDAVVFVADSQAAMLDANSESLRSLRQNLLVNEIDPSIPQVIQFNKRDLPTALPISVLNARLNPRNLPYFEAVAFKGRGVEETLKGITRALFQWLSKYYGEAEAASAAAGIQTPAEGKDAAPAAPRVMIRVPQETIGQPKAPAPPAAPTPALAPPAPPPARARPSPAPAAAPPAPATAPSAPRPMTVAPAPAPPSARPTTAVPAPTPAPPRPIATAAPVAPTPPAPAPPAAPVAPPAPVSAATDLEQVAAAEFQARPLSPAIPAEESTPATVVFVKQPRKVVAPAPAAPAPPAPAPPAPPLVEKPVMAATPSARPLAPAMPEDEEPAATFVFVKQKPAAPPTTPPPAVIPAAPKPQPIEVPATTIAIKPQPVVVTGTTTAKPAGMPAMNVPPPMPVGAKLEPKKPAPPAQVFREPEKPAVPSEPPPRGEGLRRDQWLYLLDGTQRGPIDVEDLIDLVLTSIPENTKVWHPGLEGWVQANQVRDIADEIPPPLPIPGAQRGYAGSEEDMPDFNTVPAMLRTVLIADEDAAFRKYLAMPLAAQGFTIYEAADGSAAWQLAVQNRPWMILADISMPEVDGFEFCRRVRNHPLLQRMPVLFISGSDKYKERYRALQIGADDFLSKNMPIRELLMRIQLLMTRYSDLSGSGEQKPGATEVAGAFQGRIEVFGAPALLQMCAQGRLTGLFTSLAEDAANTATVMGFREGDIISATAGSKTGADGVYAFLGWEKGSFKFTPGDPGEGAPLAQSVEHLLLEGCRLLDESRKDGEGDEGGASFA